MITAVADASQVAEARRLVERLRAPVPGVPEARVRPGGDRRHRTGDQPAEAWRRRPNPRGASRRRGRRRPGTAGAGSRQRHGRCRPLHGGRLLHRRQPGQRSRRDRAAGRRPADLFASRPGQRDHGALLPRRLARAYAAGLRNARCSGAAVAPYPGEQVCGDHWAFSETAHGRTLLVADGAGHGIEAARAADMAVQVFRRARGRAVRRNGRTDASRADAHARRRGCRRADR